LVSLEDILGLFFILVSLEDILGLFCYLSEFEILHDKRVAFGESGLI
jgi:hypothetical protein